jgi:hypothetical protein
LTQYVREFVRIKNNLATPTQKKHHRPKVGVLEGTESGPRCERGQEAVRLQTAEAHRRRDAAPARSSAGGCGEDLPCITI